MFRPMLAVLVLATTAPSSQVVIANGPHAGTYALPSEIMCLLDSKRHQISIAYTRDPAGADAKTLTEAVINIYDMDAAVPGKSGQGAVIFGPAETKAQSTTYAVNVPSTATKGTIALTKKGNGLTATLDGKTAQGITLHIALECAAVAKF